MSMNREQYENMSRASRPGAPVQNSNTGPTRSARRAPPPRTRAPLPPPVPYQPQPNSRPAPQPTRPPPSQQYQAPTQPPVTEIILPADYKGPFPPTSMADLQQAFGSSGIPPGLLQPQGPAGPAGPAGPSGPQYHPAGGAPIMGGGPGLIGGGGNGGRAGYPASPMGYGQGSSAYYGQQPPQVQRHPGGYPGGPGGNGYTQGPQSYQPPQNMGAPRSFANQNQMMGPEAGGGMGHQGPVAYGRGQNNPMGHPGGPGPMGTRPGPPGSAGPAGPAGPGGPDSGPQPYNASAGGNGNSGPSSGFSL